MLKCSPNKKANKVLDGFLMERETMSYPQLKTLISKEEQELYLDLIKIASSSVEHLKLKRSLRNIAFSTNIQLN